MEILRFGGDSKIRRLEDLETLRFEDFDTRLRLGDSKILRHEEILSFRDLERKEENIRI